MAPKFSRDIRRVIDWKGVNGLDTWKLRPIDVANNLNPAFCSILINASISEYQKKVGEGLDYSLVFLVLPIILHYPTREKLPRSVSTKLHVWIQKNQDVKIGFAERVNHTIPFTKETLLFGLQHGILDISDSGKVQSLKKTLTYKDLESGQELSTYYQKSKFLGRWLADSGDSRLIFIMWGIRP